MMSRSSGERAALRIGEVADRVGLSLRTIRHYDEIGLVVPSDRSAGGFRLYTEADVVRLSWSGGCARSTSRSSRSAPWSRRWTPR